MDVVIEIVDGPVDERRIEAKEPGGRALVFREQRAWMHVPGERYPFACKVSLWHRPAYPAGRYRFGPRSYQVGKFGSPELARDLDLQPMPAAAAASRAAG